jgi:uncharacterized protein YhbP (UPF0306 family)
MNDPLRSEVLAFLAGHNVIHLGTVADGVPHVASLFYVNDGFTLYWVSDPATRHSRELAQSPRVAATIAPEYSSYKEIRGLQVVGRAARVEGLAGVTAGLFALAGKFSFFNEFVSGPVALVERLGKATVYRFDIERIVFIDNTKGFGHKDVLDLTSAD